MLLPRKPLRRQVRDDGSSECIRTTPIWCAVDGSLHLEMLVWQPDKYNRTYSRGRSYRNIEKLPSNILHQTTYYAPQVATPLSSVQSAATPMGIQGLRRYHHE